MTIEDTTPTSARAPRTPVDDPPALAGEIDAKPRSQWALFKRRFFHHRGAMFGLVLLVLLFVACFGARWLAPYGRNGINLGDSNTSATSASPSGDSGGSGSSLLDDLLKKQEADGTFRSAAQPPNHHHWFGTDVLGRDYLTEVLYAGQISLKIGVAVALLSTVVGTAIGALAGYFGRFTDQMLMRATDLFLIVPQIALLAVAVKRFGNTDTTIILVLAFLAWMTIARVVRGEVLAIREREYVDAARVAGASHTRIILRHLLPNMVGPITVNATLAMAAAVVTESTLSYLGFGVQPPKTSWGNMLSSASEFVGTKGWLIYFPGLFILLTVLGINFLGDGLRDAFDPQAKH